MNENSKAIIILCSHICSGENINPLEPKEWSKLAKLMLENNIEPFQLLSLNEEIISKLQLDNKTILRITNLVKRSASITFEINKYENMGIKIVTRADSNYPSIIKKKLKNDSPPILYYCGNLEILNKELVGFVGSRIIDDKDKKTVEKLVKNVINKGYGIVSGGAKGIDEISSKFALEHGGYVVEFLADSILKKIKNKTVMKNIRENKLLICSLMKPDAGFNVGIAMMRNKYIYTSSIGTVVIKTDLKKGGTWAGATENIRKKYSPICCLDSDNLGNQELIKLGASKINEEWQVEFEEPLIEQTAITQISLF